MAVRFEYKGVNYLNAVDLAKAIPLMTSVLVGWYEDAELLCANAGGLCYDSRVNNISGRKLLIHCRDSGHNTVLEHGSATFVKKVPIFVARQDLRARIASFDERSLRYCRADDGGLTYFIPHYLQPDFIEKARQKDESYAHKLQEMREEWIEDHERAIERYSKYTDVELNEMWDALGLNHERVRETMRARLPLGINTIYMDTRNLWSWYHHSAKRLCLRAQKEIREIRWREVQQLKKVYPIIFGDVNRPCLMKGCPEVKPCGKVTLDPQTKKAWSL